jgi:hypothetical protein
MKNYYERKFLEKVLCNLIFTAIFIVGFLLAIFICDSCCPRVYPSSQTSEKIGRTDIAHSTLDSVFFLRIDSITTVIERKGDTVFFTKELIKWRTKDKVVFRTDTVVTTKTETKTEVQTVEIEKPLKWWQKALMWAGVIGFLYVGVKKYSRFI